jgi:hypothetical protein
METPKGVVTVKCKQCLNCRISKKTSLELRALLELSTSTSAEFLTLTFSEPPPKPDCQPIQAFLKRLRKWNVTKGNIVPIRYYYVGEYGERTRRFHYHALIFNSLSLDTPLRPTGLWPHGFLHTGQVTPSSISYTAAYNTKFIKFDAEEKPFANWSLKPALGYDGMRCVIRSLIKSSNCPQYMPTSLKIRSRQYCLDDAMRKAVNDEMASNGLAEFTPSLAQMEMERILELKLGNDKLDQAIHREVKKLNNLFSNYHDTTF